MLVSTNVFVQSNTFNGASKLVRIIAIWPCWNVAGSMPVSMISKVLPWNQASGRARSIVIMLREGRTMTVATHIRACNQGVGGRRMFSQHIKWWAYSSTCALGSHSWTWLVSIKPSWNLCAGLKPTHPFAIPIRPL